MLCLSWHHCLWSSAYFLNSDICHFWHVTGIRQKFGISTCSFTAAVYREFDILVIHLMEPMVLKYVTELRIGLNLIKLKVCRLLELLLIIHLCFCGGEENWKVVSTFPILFNFFNKLNAMVY